MDRYRNSPLKPRQSKPVSSLRQDESNLAKVAGFTGDAGNRPAGEAPQSDEWESWRSRLDGKAGRSQQVAELMARPLVIGSAVLVLCVIGAAIPLWLLTNHGTEVARLPLHSEDTHAGETLPATVSLTSEEIARHFLDAATIEEMLPWVRQPERVAPLMRRYYTGGSGHTPGETVNSMRNLGTILVKNGFVYERFHVATRSGDRLLAVCETSSGRRVDWECFVRYCPLPWQEFLGNRDGAGTPSEFRVFLAPSVDHSELLTPAGEHRFFRIESPDLNVDVLGYVKKDSHLDALFTRWFRQPEDSNPPDWLATTPGLMRDKRQRATTLLRHESRIPNADRDFHIVEITGISNMGWVSPD